MSESERKKKKILEWFMKTRVKEVDEELRAKKEKLNELQRKQEEEEDKAIAWLHGQYGDSARSEEEMKRLEKEFKEKQIEALELYKEEIQKMGVDTFSEDMLKMAREYTDFKKEQSLRKEQRERMHTEEEE